MARLFGTDGVRGVANRDLDCMLAYRIGAVGAYVLTNEVHSPRILIGMDTRKSGPMLAAALTAGICSVGGDVLNVGVLPTPALAYLVRLYEADAAVMISASHNPMEYNGIKWFDGRGFKLSDAIEDRIEDMIRTDAPLPKPEGREVGTVIPAPRASRDYCDYLVSKSTGRFDGLKVVLDCANGATSYIGKKVFERLGAEVVATSCEPDGMNINDDCGSTHPESLQQKVVATGADIGFAFDGDADRLISCDEHGNIVDGDQAMGILALHMQKKGTLKNDTLVITVMSNLGLKKRMQRAGIRLAETKVGDRYVLENMLANGHAIGGEQSGHIIFLEHMTTGDGQLAALQFLSILSQSGQKASELRARIPRYPQVLKNVRVGGNDEKTRILQSEGLAEAVREAEAQLGADGRVLIRASGTEPLIRVMVEAGTQQQAQALADALSNTVESLQKFEEK